MKYHKTKDEDVNDTCDLVNWKNIVGGITMEYQPVDEFIGNILQEVIFTNAYHKVLLHLSMKNLRFLYYH